MIGIGIDAVEVDRFRRVLARTPGVARRLFTEAERAYGDRKRDLATANFSNSVSILRAYGDRKRDPTERLAARVAAKEAVMKALGVGLGAFAFHDVEVVRAPSGQPVLELRGRAEALARRQGVTGWRLSLTHTHRVAEAVAVAL